MLIHNDQEKLVYRLNNEQIYEEVKADKYLTALNAQYALNDGQGARVQDSTPSNYWTPIATFGNVLFNAIKNKTSGSFDTIVNTQRQLAQLQADIESSTK